MATVGPPSWDLRGDVRCRIEVAGVQVEVVADLVHDEIARRSTQGPPAALGWRQLGALSLLPYGVAIPWLEVDLGTRLMIDGLPPGAVTSHPRHVERRWRPALELRALCCTGATPDPALDDISMFAAVAPRVLTVTVAPGDPATLADRAARLGVGVLLDTGTGVRALTGPPSSDRVRDDARRWELAETAWVALRAAAAPPPVAAG